MVPTDLADQQVHDIAGQEISSHRRESDHLCEPVHEDHYTGVALDSEEKIYDEVLTHTLNFC